MPQTKRLLAEGKEPMNDKRTEKQKYLSWVKAVIKLQLSNWKCAGKTNLWIFTSPSGKDYDLSAANLDKLTLIEETGNFLVN